MSFFLEMGGYGSFIWPCYILTLGGMIWIAISSWRRAKSAAAILADLTAEQE